MAIEHFNDEQSTRSFATGAKQSPEWVTLLGYVLLIISTAAYGIEEYYDVTRGDDNFTLFFVHYFVSIVYVIILLGDKSYGIVRSWRKEHLHKTIILLNLFLVSAYALNRELPVFEDSVPWFCVYILVMSLVMLSYRYFNQLPKYINYMQQALLGSALILYLYMTIYVANFYLFGTIGIILIGLGAHIFVPALFLLSTIRLLMVTHSPNLKAGWVMSGAAVTIAFIVGFVVEWNSRVNAMERIANQSVIHADTELPAWVKVAQSVKNDWITERILKSKLIYSVSNDHFHWDTFPNGSSWDEKRKHDPLVFLAGGLNNISLSGDDRKTILKTLTDSRHRAQERLWSGDNLTTSYIVTDVDIYPELRLAYAEHYVNVRNNALKNNRWWGTTQEAIYTFQLPEGSVVTSLSLWIGGKEEKAILTSKQKASKAYTTIVGVEQRDPSVVHWQEGNTVSVRVFPCTSDEERKFKIGITSPLAVANGKTTYKNVSFKGPNARAANQTSRVRIIGNTERLNIPGTFDKNINGDYMSEGTYDPDLTITMDALPIKDNRFSFDGYTYSISTSAVQAATKRIEAVYLDINNSWTPTEIQQLYGLLNHHKVYVYDAGAFVLLSSENWAAATDLLRLSNYSLFPFHHIGNTESSLVITKGNELSPYLRDLKASAFADGLTSFFASGKKVNVYNLEGGTSTYVKSLREFRSFNFTQGDTERLFELLKTNTFPSTTESDEQIVLHESAMIIQKTRKISADLKDNAPDHLARLFAYNNIMRQVGRDFYKDDFTNEKLVDEAATAYVVSPVSSLIVLETKADYERFGIKDKDNSLHNASKNSSGAVPEPHEWALITVFLLFVVVQFARRFRTRFQL